jgi:hypothetical protein
MNYLALTMRNSRVNQIEEILQNNFQSQEKD